MKITTPMIAATTKITVGISIYKRSWGVFELIVFSLGASCSFALPNFFNSSLPKWRSEERRTFDSPVWDSDQVQFSNSLSELSKSSRNLSVGETPERIFKLAEITSTASVSQSSSEDFWVKLYQVKEEQVKVRNWVSFFTGQGAVFQSSTESDLISVSQDWKIWVKPLHKEE